MSLTVALAILGGLVLAALVAHGAWQASRASPRKAIAPRTEPEQRLEPTMGIENITAPETAVIGTLPSGSADLPRDDMLPMPSLLRKNVRLDASIDAIAPIVLESPMSGDVAVMHMPTARRAGSKPFLIEGLNVATQAWETPSAGERYSEFQAGVQLCNRNGPINEIEYSEFVQKVQNFAEPIGGRVDAPDMLAVVARARELDAFAQKADAVLTAELTSSTPSGWSTEFVHQCAAKLGFVSGALPGRLVLPSAGDRGEPPVLMLNFDPQAALADSASMAVVRSVRLSLDVPQTPESAEPFAIWHRVASDLTREMTAQLVDHEGRPIPLSGFATIGQQLSGLYRDMAAHDLPAGSAAARRLFS